MSTDEVGPLKLKEFSCQMKVDERSTASNPICVLNFVMNKRNQDKSLKDECLQNNSNETGVDEDRITFEMDSSILDTLLEGLHRIQNTLSAAATKST